MFKKSKYSLTIAVTLLVVLLMASTSVIAKSAKSAEAVDTGKTSESIHYKYTNFASELGAISLSDFGDRVDLAMKSADAYRLSTLAMELYLAEENSGKTSGTLTALQLLQSTAEIAEQQKSKNGLLVVASAMDILGEGKKASSYRTVADNLQERSSSITFDLCVDNWDNDSYSIYVDGSFVAEVEPWGDECLTNVGYVGPTSVKAVGWKSTVRNSVYTEAWSSYTWKIDVL